MSKTKEIENTSSHSMCQGKKSTIWRIFWGLFFVVVATAVILSIFDILPLGLNVGWLVLAFLVAIAIRSLFSLHWFGVFLPAAGIVTILAKATEYLSLTDSSIGAVWVAAGLLSIGFTILFHRRNRWYGLSQIHHQAIHDNHTHYSRHHPDKYENVINRADDSEIAVDVNFGSTIKYVNSDDFKYARLNCRFGSIKAYFDNATIKGKNAIIEINSSFSGVELYVPHEWSIVNNLNQSLAGVDEKNPRRVTADQIEKTVTLTGDLNLSGLEIIYV